MLHVHHDQLVRLFLRKIRYSLKKDALRGALQISTAVGSLDGRCSLDSIAGLEHARFQLCSAHRAKARGGAIEAVGYANGLARVHRGHRAALGPDNCLDAAGYL